MTTASGNQGGDFHGRVLGRDSAPVGTCFHLGNGYLVTAFHVIDGIGSGEPGREVRIDLMDGSATVDATVDEVDQTNDLALLHTETHPAGAVVMLALSDDQTPDTSVHTRGFATLPGMGSSVNYKEQTATGRWLGSWVTEDGVKQIGITMPGAQPGLSGAPVIRTSDDAVIGVQAGRYKSPDSWSRDTALVAPIEQLLRLIRDKVDVPLYRVPPVESRHSDQLTEISVDPNPCFVRTDTWDDAWQEARETLEAGEILVVTALPGVGASTFTQELLGELFPHSVTRLEPADWRAPTAAALPRGVRCGYVLELSDPEEDKLTRSFIESLGQMAEWYASMKSALAITVPRDMWRSLGKRPASGVRAVSLDVPPEPLALILSHVQVRAPHLREALDDTEIQGHLRGRNVIQAMEAVDAIEKTAASQRLGPEATPEELQTFKSNLIHVLDDHRKQLDELFAEPGSSALSPTTDDGMKPARPLEDRCLLVTVAYEKQVPIIDIERHSRHLLKKLQDPTIGDSDTASYGIRFAGPGLRNRLNSIGAEPAQGELVSFRNPGFGEAVLPYVWDNYATIRDVMIEWMVDLSAKEGVDLDTAANTIVTLVRRHHDVEFFKRNSAIRTNDDILVRVAYELAQDEHMGRRIIRVLYNWAASSTMQPVVIDVCNRLIVAGQHRDIALNRLRRVADSGPTTSDTRDQLLEKFRSLACSEDSDLQAWFFDKTHSWFEEPSRDSAKLAFIASLYASTGGIPWSVSPRWNTPDLSRMLSAVLSTQEQESGIWEALNNLIERVAKDDDQYGHVLDQIATAFKRNGQMLAIINYISGIQNVGLHHHRDVAADLARRFDLPDTPDSHAATDR